MDSFVKLNNQVAGRDKIARLFQYLSRFLWNRYQQSNKNGVEGLKQLEFQLSTFRKLLRLGKCIDVLYSTLPLFHHEDATVRSTVILSKICNSLFLLADHILWLGRSDLYSINTSKWSQLSNKAWLYSITMNIVRDLYEIQKIFKLHKTTILPKNGIQNTGDILKSFVNALVILQKYQYIVLDTIKNGCDFFIPFTALGFTKLSPGTIGLLGAISSIVGLIVLLDPSFKLSPM